MRVSHLVAVLVVMLATAVACPAATRLVVDAGERERIDTPVSVQSKTVPGGAGESSVLWEVRDGRRIAVPAQWGNREQTELSWILAGVTRPGQKRIFELSSRADAAGAAPARVIAARQVEGAAEFVHGSTALLRYNHATVPPPPGRSPRFARGGFVHPLSTPAGTVLSRIHPADHIHHLGLWNPWTKARFEGRNLDFWNLGDGQATVRSTRLFPPAAGPVFCHIVSELEHVDLTAPGGERVAINEVLELRAWQPAGEARGWILDVTTTQRCATESPLEILKYHYGGLGLRATGDWNDSTANCLTSEGKNRKDGNGTRARWCNVFGRTKQGPAGIVFMSHPANHEHPEPMRIWPQGDVFFNFCPVVNRPWTLEPGKSYILRYRLYIYDGTVDRDSAERLWQDFAHPVVVRVEED